MADLAYRDVDAMNRIEARLRLVTTYHETGSIRETAPRWYTSRQVLRKWVRRYDAPLAHMVLQCFRTADRPSHKSRCSRVIHRDGHHYPKLTVLSPSI